MRCFFFFFLVHSLSNYEVNELCKTGCFSKLGERADRQCWKLYILTITKGLIVPWFLLSQSEEVKFVKLTGDASYWNNFECDGKFD